jgi:dihydrofolate synthase/folylpolyglutamate synthase
MQYDEIVRFLENLPQYGEKSGYERTRQLLEKMGNPERQLKIIHVAGSNGKGSVCAFINQICIENGYSTGLFTSPHLVDIRERIRINNQLISREEFTSHFMIVEKFAQELKSSGTVLTYFDYLLGIALSVFAKKKLDMVVLETGLGGKLDATNAVEHPVVSVITTISLEHTAVLGDTLEKIAAEKAGIIKENVPVVFLDRKKEVSDVFYDTAKEKKAGVQVAVRSSDYQILKNNANSIDFLLHNEYYKKECFSLSTSAVYQAENCSIALTAVKLLESLGVLKLEDEKVKQAVFKTHWKGRMEQVLCDVYVDGAHNPEGIAGFIESARAICQGKKATLLFSVVNDKNFENMIQQLAMAEIFDKFIVTQLATDRKLSGDCIRDVFSKYTECEVYEMNTVSEGLEFALRQQRENGGLLFCAGSLYLAGEIEGLLGSLEAHNGKE